MIESEQLTELLFNTAGTILTVITAAYFLVTFPRKNSFRNYFLCHLISLATLLSLFTYSTFSSMPFQYGIYLRIFIFGVITTPSLLIAVIARFRRLTLKTHLMVFLPALFTYFIYLFCYHYKISGTLNLTVTSLHSIPKPQRHTLDLITRSAQILQTVYLIVAAVIYQILSKGKEKQLKNQILWILAPTLFTIAVTFSVINEYWSGIYYATMVNAIIITIALWLESRDIHARFGQLPSLLEEELISYLTKFRHSPERLKQLFQLIKSGELPQSILLLKILPAEKPTHLTATSSRFDYIEEALKETNHIPIVIALSHNEYALIFSETVPENLPEELQKKLSENLVTVIAQPQASGFMELPQAFQQCRQALEYAEQLDTSLVIKYIDLPEEERQAQYPFQLKRELLDEINRGNYTSSLNLLKEIIPQINSISFNHPEVLAIRLQELAAAIIDIAINSGITQDQFTKPINIPSKDDLASVWEEHLNKLVEKICRHINEKRQNQIDNVIDKAIAIIEEKYSENLTSTNVAKELSISPSYFMALFKKQTGMSFSEFLRKERIAIAKQLLLSTDLSISEIALKVGIESPAYFTSQFKKFENQTPRQFRQNNSAYHK